MDDRNERLVIDRIVKNCCSINKSPQYFLVSPKLLPGLRALEHDSVTALVVCNGPGALLDWDLKSYKKRLQQQYAEIEFSDIDEDNENDDDNEEEEDHDDENGDDDNEDQIVLSSRNQLNVATRIKRRVSDVNFSDDEEEDEPVRVPRKKLKI